MNKFDSNLVDRFFAHDYHDRGVMKWQGYYLSDHTSALNQESKNNNMRIKQITPAKMSRSDITAAINYAIIKSLPVTIYLNVRDIDFQFHRPLTGKILGYEDNNLYIGDEGFVELDQIRALIVSLPE
ncbi:hypothetical protein [Lacticaseibacillus brantae]|nr:hypothetical protein [Lacticaseibacillus brantae]